MYCSSTSSASIKILTNANLRKTNYQFKQIHFNENRNLLAGKDCIKITNNDVHLFSILVFQKETDYIHERLLTLMKWISAR